MTERSDGDVAARLGSAMGGLGASEKKTIAEISSLAQRIFVRAVVNTGVDSGVKRGAVQIGDVKEFSEEATRVFHMQEAKLAYDAALAFYKVHGEYVVKMIEGAGPGEGDGQ